MNPIIFLDFDGPLITKACYVHKPVGQHGVRPDPVCLYYLNELLVRTKARIVVSSSWRTETIKPMRTLLREWGINAPVIGVTKSIDYTLAVSDIELFLAKTRGDEIQAWIDAQQVMPAFVVLDDEDSGLSRFGERFIRVDFDVGLTEAHVQHAVTVLSRARETS